MNRQEARRILERLREYNSDYESMLNQVEVVYEMSVKGFETEVPGKEGAISVIQKVPSVSVQALQVKRNLVKDIIEYASIDEIKDTSMSVEINITPLESIL